MADGFTVDMAALSGAGREAYTLADRLRERTRGSFAGSPADFGHPGLQEAVASFQLQWRDGVAALAGQAGSVGDRLQSSSATYQAAEQHATSAALSIHSVLSV